MEDVSIDHARDDLDELLERAARGEEVRIRDPRLGIVKLQPVPPDAEQRLVRRVTDSMPPFVPLDKPRVPGRLAGIHLPLPDEFFFEPMTEDDLKLWYGED